MIPIQREEDCERHNQMRNEMFGENFTHVKSTESHAEILIEKIQDTIEKVGEEGGWYLGDGIAASQMEMRVSVCEEIST